MATSSRAKTRGKGRPAGRKASKGSGKGSGVGAWAVAGLVLVGGITVYEHRGEAARLIGHYAPFAHATRQPVQTARRQVEPRDDAGRKRATDDNVRRTNGHAATLVSVPKPGQRPAGELTMIEPAFTGTWFLCASRTDNCILDADTIVHNGKTIRIADIDTPATKKAGCEDERQRGMAAMMRLKDVLNQGPFTEVEAIGRSGDRAGGALRVLLRNGQSVGQQLVKEGLAKAWTGKHQPWCGQKV